MIVCGIQIPHLDLTMPERANPEGYGRRPEDGPLVSREELDRRQAAKLNATNNGVIVDGHNRGFVTPERSETTDG